eukprot:3241637-Amphidinium_carterae.1
MSSFFTHTCPTPPRAWNKLHQIEQRSVTQQQIISARDTPRDKFRQRGRPFKAMRRTCVGVVLFVIACATLIRKLSYWNASATRQ